MVKKISKQKVIKSILYVWDLGNTLFVETWNKKKSGFASYDAWLENRLGKKLGQMTPREHEQGYKIPYQAGWYFNLDLEPGFKKVLAWTKNNETFSTGNKEQFIWRSQYLNKKYKLEIKKYFIKLGSTFDYGETNIKTPALLKAYLNQKYQAGYRTLVYTDDKLFNLKSFKQVIDKNKSLWPGLTCRLYHLLNRSAELVNKKDYYVVGTLLDLLNNEKKLIINQ